MFFLLLGLHVKFKLVYFEEKVGVHCTRIHRRFQGYIAAMSHFYGQQNVPRCPLFVPTQFALHCFCSSTCAKNNVNCIKKTADRHSHTYTGAYYSPNLIKFTRKRQLFHVFRLFCFRLATQASAESRLALDQATQDMHAIIWRYVQPFESKYLALMFTVAFTEHPRVC